MKNTAEIDNQIAALLIEKEAVRLAGLWNYENRLKICVERDKERPGRFVSRVFCDETVMGSDCPLDAVKDTIEAAKELIRDIQNAPKI